MSVVAREKVYKKLIDQCKKVRNCKYCDGFNGVVKHVHGEDATKIVHERYM